MPKLELGDLDAVEKLKNQNIPPLAKLAKEGYAILTTASCSKITALSPILDHMMGADRDTV